MKVNSTSFLMETLRGGNQGDVATPPIFMMMMVVFWHAFKKKFPQYSVMILAAREGPAMTSLRSTRQGGEYKEADVSLNGFADDMTSAGIDILMARSYMSDYQELQVDYLGQKMHADGTSDKSPCMLALPSNNANVNQFDTSTIHLRGGGTVNYFSSIRILGTMFDSKLSFLTDILQKKHILWNKFKQYRDFLTNPHFDLFDRMDEFISLVWKAAIHHSAVWPDQNTKQLVTVYEKVMRRMLNTSTKRLKRNDMTMDDLLERNDVPTAECLLRREFLTAIRTMLKDPQGLGRFALFGQLDLANELQRKNRKITWFQSEMDKKLSTALRQLAFNIERCTDPKVKFCVKGNMLSKKEVARILCSGHCEPRKQQSRGKKHKCQFCGKKGRLRGIEFKGNPFLVYDRFLEHLRTCSLKGLRKKSKKNRFFSDTFVEHLRQAMLQNKPEILENVGRKDIRKYVWNNLSNNGEIFDILARKESMITWIDLLAGPKALANLIMSYVPQNFRFGTNGAFGTSPAIQDMY